MTSPANSRKEVEKQSLIQDCTDRNVSIILILILIIGSILRFYGLEIQSLWLDELVTLHVATGESEGLIESINYTERGAPFAHYLLVHLVVKYIGVSEAILRFPSAVSGVLSIFIIFLLGKRLYSYKEGLIAATLLSVLYVPIFYSQEARAYSLLLLFTMLATFFWILILWSLNKKTRIAYHIIFGYIMFSIILSYTHYFGLYLIALQGLGAMLLFVRRRQSLFYILLIYFFILLAYLPCLQLMLDRLTSLGPFWVAPPKITAFLGYLGFLFNKELGRIDLHAGGLLFIVLILYSFLLFHSLNNILKTKEYKNMRSLLLSPGLLLGLWLMVPFFGAYIISLLLTPILCYHYLIISLPAAYILLARSITQLPIHLKKQAIITILIAVLFLSHLFYSRNYYTAPQKPQVREAITYILENDHRYKDSLITASNYFTNTYFKIMGTDRRVFMSIEAKDISMFMNIINREDPHYIWHIGHFKFKDHLKKIKFTLIDYKEFYGYQVWLFENNR